MNATPYDQQPANAELELAAIKRINESKEAGVPEAKITIFIEIGDRIKKIEIPQARYLTIENNHGSAFRNSMDFSLTCEPQYDLDRNNYLTEEIRTVEDSWLTNG